jgi:4-hydroxybenzoyl-CoA reductase subunit beta
MQPFDAQYPASTDEVVALLDEHGDKAKLCAGGTDLIPNVKHSLHEPDVVVHLTRVKDLRGVTEDGDSLVIGAMTTLHDVEHDALVLAHAPALAEAAGLVAGPQLRRMGTLGGNLCLDTRCLYYNQTYFWRESLGFCLKKDGTHCHVVDSGKKCVAAASNDAATMLLAMSSEERPVEVEIQSKDGKRWVALDDLYVADGIHNTVLTPRDLLTRVRVPKAKAGARAGYAKLRHRASIDYPLLCVGARFELDDAGNIAAARVLASALAARPKDVNCSLAIGRPLDDAVIDELAALAHKKINPLTNIADDPAWRKDMVPVLVREACATARDR